MILILLFARFVIRDVKNVNSHQVIANHVRLAIIYINLIALQLANLVIMQKQALVNVLYAMKHA